MDHLHYESESLANLPGSPGEKDIISIPYKSSTDGTREYTLASLLEAFRQGGWPAINTIPGMDPTNKMDIAFSLAKAFWTEKNLPRAWAVMEPFASQAGEWSVDWQLSMAAASLTAGDFKTSHKLLSNAIKEEIQTPEELFLALELAYSHRDGELFQFILKDMQLRHPENTLTRRGEFFQLFYERDFENALKIAKELNLPIETAQCRAFLSDEIDADEFLHEMVNIDELEQGLISCADEALYRNQPLPAISWASQIPQGHPLFEKAFVIRMKALQMGLQGTPKNHFSGWSSIASGLIFSRRLFWCFDNAR